MSRLNSRINEIRKQLPLEEEDLLHELSQEMNKAVSDVTMPEHLIKLKVFMQQQEHNLIGVNNRKSQERCRKFFDELKSALKNLNNFQSEEQLKSFCKAAVASFKKKAIGPAKPDFKQQLLQFCVTQIKSYRLRKVFPFITISYIRTR